MDNGGAAHSLGTGLENAASEEIRASNRGSGVFKRPSLWIFVVLSAAALILLWQLFVPPVIGIADNSDFGKLIARYDLGSPASFTYIANRYQFDRRYRYQSDFYSSELLLIQSALALNKVLSKDGSFDLRVMGFVHAALYLAALALFLPLLARLPPAVRIVFCALVLFMFCDVMYVSYLNTFYMDVIALLAMLFAAIFYMRAIVWRRRSDAILFLASSIVMITSKPQYAILGFWLAALVWLARQPLWTGRKVAAGIASAVLILSAAATFEIGAPRSYTAKNCFNVVFYQVLPASKNVDRTLADLGLDDSYRVWIGKHAYEPGSRLEDPDFYEPFLRKISYRRLGQFYLTHLPDAYRALRTSLNSAGRQRPGMGNFDASTGLPPRTESQSFAFWSDCKRSLFDGRGPVMLFTFLALAVLVLALLAIQRRPLPPGASWGVIGFLVMAATNTLVGSLADTFDMPRHHLLFYAQFDMLLLTAFWLGVRRLREPSRV